MPLRSRAKLLALMAALVGLCAAGAGCQTGSVCQSCLSGTCQPAAGSAYTVVRRPTTQEPPALAGSCDNRCCSCAVMLRPVPIASTSAPTASQDGPVLQRVSGDPAVVSTESGVARLATLERPQPVAFVPAARPDAEQPGLPPPTVQPEGNPVAAPPPRAPLPAPRIAPLPAPRMVPKALVKNTPPEGYPSLPPVVITHPPEAPREFAKRALSDYIIEPPDILQIDLSPLAPLSDPKGFPIRGTHLVRPDGTIGLGPLPPVFVAGLTLEQAKLKIAERIFEVRGRESERAEKLPDLLKGLKVDVAAYNSKYYYVITDGGGFGEQVYRILCTGNETVLDAIAQVAGLPAVASKSHIWVARATPTHAHGPNILPVDWRGITQRGSAATNYQIYPGDRIYVNSDKLIRADSFLAKVISPIERLFGVTLLGSTTINSIKNGGIGGSGGNR
jgi:polysaccharide export outer membrane protein